MKDPTRRKILKTGIMLGAVLPAIKPLSVRAEGHSPLDAPPIDRSPITVTMTGVGVGGYYRVLVEAIGTILRNDYPGSAVTFKPSTPAGGLQMVAEGKADITFAAGTPELEAALAGKYPFKTPQQGKLGWLVFFHDRQIFYFLADKGWADRYQIRSYDDIAKRKPPVRIANNRKGNLQTVVIAEDLFKAHGFTSHDIDLWGGATSWVSGPEGLDLLSDGKVDMWVNANFVEWTNLSKLSKARELVWLDISRQKIESVARKWDYRVATIPSGAYNFIPESNSTIRQWASATVGLHVPDLTVTKILTALQHGAAQIRAVHPSMSGFSLIEMSKKPTGVIPYHPAAERFYELAAKSAKPPS